MAKNIHKKGMHLVIVSFLVFIVLNIIENYIHYNNGRNHDHQFAEFSIPSTSDCTKMIIIMLCFGILQASFTYMLD